MADAPIVIEPDPVVEAFKKDIDRTLLRANIGRLAVALAPIHPYLRGAPEGLPFRFDAATIERGLNFTLETTLGDVDLLGEGEWARTIDLLITNPKAWHPAVSGLSVSFGKPRQSRPCRPPVAASFHRLGHHLGHHEMAGHGSHQTRVRSAVRSTAT
ncbi:MAG: hypothetical protein EXQ53_04050 [Acidobacteria bacterium]|nr:hypothetical protein [Acidobacteriota bacterium]